MVEVLVVAVQVVVGLGLVEEVLGVVVVQLVTVSLVVGVLMFRY